MLNLEKFVMSLKCSWIRRIVSGEQAWIGIMNALYGNNIASCIEDFGDDFYTNMINSFAANVADRRRHSRLPTSPIGDLNPLPNPILSPSFTENMLCLRCF